MPLNDGILSLFNEKNSPPTQPTNQHHCYELWIAGVVQSIANNRTTIIIENSGNSNAVVAVIGEGVANTLVVGCDRVVRKDSLRNGGDGCRTEYILEAEGIRTICEQTLGYGTQITRRN